MPVASFTKIDYLPEIMFHTKIEPLIGYGIKGVAWYQGEANTGKAAEYRSLLPTMIGDWRRRWGQGDFPFLIVQLANYMKPPSVPVKSNWAMLREAQAIVARKVANGGLAVAIDLGEEFDIHPAKKKEVGERLALAAQHVAYGDQKLVYSGPEYKSMEIVHEKIILSFHHKGGGLVSKNGELMYFAIAGEDRKFYWAKAEIRSGQVIVWSDDVKKPVAVRYAWADNPAGCNLYNKEGLPAAPFRTDDWDN